MKRLKYIQDFSGPTLIKERSLLLVKEDLQMKKYKRLLNLKEKFAREQIKISLSLIKKELIPPL
jgi:hypothetical protein